LPCFISWKAVFGTAAKEIRYCLCLQRCPERHYWEQSVRFQTLQDQFCGTQRWRTTDSSQTWQLSQKHIVLNVIHVAGGYRVHFHFYSSDGVFTAGLFQCFHVTHSSSGGQLYLSHLQSHFTRHCLCRQRCSERDYWKKSIRFQTLQNQFCGTRVSVITFIRYAQNLNNLWVY
jgi:hypothetical protein